MLKRYSSLSAILLVLSFCLPASWASQGWQPMAETIRTSERDTRQYQAIKLDNGLRVLLVSDKQAPKSLAALSLPIGSLDDPASQQGLAHYLEHMVLMGSQRYPEPDGFSQFLTKHGGSYNASTASYRTSFYLEVENQAFPTAVDLLADAIAAPLLDPVNADRERNAVNAELTMARSGDGMRMNQVDAETVNPMHPRSQFFGGNLETLSDKPDSKLQDELNRFYQRFYSSNIMVGVLYSDRSLPELAELAVTTFGRIDNRQASVPEIAVPVVTEKQQGLLIHYVPVQPYKQLRIDFRIANNSADFRSKTDTYLGYLIGNRSENTLADWLQKQGLADGIGAGADPVIDRSGGVFTIAVSLTDKGAAHREEVIAAIFDYLRLIRSEGIRLDYFNEISNVLEQEFRYQSINRDMGYVEELSDMLLRLPFEHVLDGDYLADRFDPQAVAARLDQMTPQSARIWYIGPDEPHNKVAYFVDAPYQVEQIKPELLQRWQQTHKAPALSLPGLNPYIADNFALIKPAEGATKPTWVVNNKQVRAMYMPSRFFADEPKANVIIALRTPLAQKSARNQVLFDLNDYLADLALAELRYQASVGGIEIAYSKNYGLMFSADGFTQRMPYLLNKLLTEYRDFVPTQPQLDQAKKRYIEMLDGADKVRAYELALQPIRSLSIIPYTERVERRKIVDTVTLSEVNKYRQQLLTSATPELLVIGNLTPTQVKTLAQDVVTILKTTGNQWWHGEELQIERQLKANLTATAASSDSALISLFVPLGYDEKSGEARSRLLTQILHPWFYQQLRTEEQLGYALFALPVRIGQQSGLGFVLQSNSKVPAYLQQRYQAFYKQAGQKLSEMSAAEFNQYKQGLINELEQRPQTLGEEAGRLRGDFDRSNYSFDSRDKLIAEIKQLSLADLILFYNQAISEQNGLTILSQVVGQGERSAADFASPEGMQTFDNASSLQQQFTVRARK